MVIDAVPQYRRGVLATLSEAGVIAVAGSEDLVTDQFSGALISIRRSGDLDLIRRARAVSQRIGIVAILAGQAPDTWRAAIASGANTALEEDVPSELLVLALQASIHGLSVVPTAVAQALAPSQLGQAPDLSPAEAGWLARLAAGATVVDLARDASYSEREMYRLLATVYGRLGVSSRSEALVRAAHLGLLASDP